MPSIPRVDHAPDHCAPGSGGHANGGPAARRATSFLICFEGHLPERSPRAPVNGMITREAYAWCARHMLLAKLNSHRSLVAPQTLDLDWSQGAYSNSHSSCGRQCQLSLALSGDPRRGVVSRCHFRSRAHSPVANIRWGKTQGDFAGPVLVK